MNQVAIQDEIYTLWTGLRDKVMDPDLWIKLIWIILQIIIIWVAARILYRITSNLTNKLISRKPTKNFKIDERRAKTLVHLINNILMYTIYFLAILMILGKLNFELGPLIAGAGILGLAVGFGAQNLVKDIITGFFIVFEDQFGVGDYISVGNYTGTVEELGLRVTKIRKWTGELHIIPNGSIIEVTNYSTHNSIAVIDVSVAYEENIEKVTEILKEILKNSCNEIEDIVNCPEVLGVQNLGASDVVMRITAETKPMGHFSVARKLREIIKEGFVKEDIEIPYPRLVTYKRTEE